jgi:hypothetical protein
VPFRVVLDSYGQLYVTDEECYRMIQFSSNSNSTTYGQNFASITDPQELFINPLTGDIYATSRTGSSTYRFPKNSTSGVIVAGAYGSFEVDFYFTHVLFLFKYNDKNFRRLINPPKGFIKLMNPWIYVFFVYRSL